MVNSAVNNVPGYICWIMLYCSYTGSGAEQETLSWISEAEYVSHSQIQTYKRKGIITQQKIQSFTILGKFTSSVVPVECPARPKEITHLIVNKVLALAL